MWWTTESVQPAGILRLRLHIALGRDVQSSLRMTRLKEMVVKKIGILFGMENTFPPALVEKINSMGIEGVEAEFAEDWRGSDG